MAPLIGKDMSEAIFLERFAALCVDPLFHVRKVCAANFGDFSNVVGSDSTEQILVSNYIDFMQQKRFCIFIMETIRNINCKSFLVAKVLLFV